MDEERIPITEDGTIYTQPEEEKLDLLNRDEFVSQVMSIIDIVSAAKGSCTLAIDGKWGSGKTFVLDKLENKLKREQDEEKASSRYLVFHYNCWQYDYYDEPLIAIVSTMIDSIKLSVDELSDEVKKNIKAVVNTMGGIIWDVFKESGKNYIKAKTGIDVVKAHERFVSEKNAIEENETERTIDDYQTFNMVMANTREKLSKLAEDITLVCVVDELDRCLPSYAIKVMERLHHLFYGVKNTVTVMAVDKAQLVNTVKQIYGDNINTNEYLRKFIDYEMTLDNGTINNRFTEKYNSYVSLFDNGTLESYFSVDDFCAALFDGIEIRTQEKLMERVQTVHKILFANDPIDEKKDYSFMCYELLLMYMNSKNITDNPIHFDQGMQKCFLSDEGFSEKFSAYVIEKWRLTNTQLNARSVVSRNLNSTMLKDEYYITNYSKNTTVMFMLVWYLTEHYKKQNDKSNINNIELNKDTPDCSKYYEYLGMFEKIVDLLNVIK